MVNRVTLIGRLGADPEIRTLENGVMVGRFGLATSENYKDRQSGEWKETTEWHDVVVWRQAAERAQRSLTKGTLLYVEGKLTHRKWQDKEGNNRKTTEVVASYFRIMGRPGEGNAGGGNYTPMPTAESAPAAPRPSGPQPTAAAPAAPPTGGAGDDGEDLPF